MFPNRTGVRVGLPVLALAWKPLPGVEKTTPRGEFELKKLAGKLLGEEKESGTPSQLISRRPEAKVPPTPLLAPPRSARNWSTAAWIDAGDSPVAWRITAPPKARPGMSAKRPDASTQRRIMIPSFSFVPCRRTASPGPIASLPSDRVMQEPYAARGRGLPL